MRDHKYPPKYTVAQYQLWEGEWELIDGHPYAMSPSANFKHQQVSREFVTAFGIKLKNLRPTCHNCEVVYEVDWIVDNHTVLRPDILIVCDQKGHFVTTPPVLIVEITSPSTALKDRNLKYEIYEEQGVAYYFIIDPDTTQYSIFELVDGAFVLNNDLETFSVSERCKVPFSLADLFGEK